METFLFAVGTLAPLLLILVVVHELGHYATARAIGVKVLEFGVGFPPRVFGFYTGRTRVLLHTNTRFVGLEGPQSLSPGQRVKVASIEEGELGLVAVEVELHRKREGAEDSSHFNRPVDHLLWHEGKVRSVEGGYIELADMLYSFNLIPLGGFVRLAGENNPTVPQSLAAKGPGLAHHGACRGSSDERAAASPHLHRNVHASPGRRIGAAHRHRGAGGQPGSGSRHTGR